jgi:hypothetical protein
MGRGQIQPFVGLHEIFRNAVAVIVQQPKHILALRIALSGGAATPHGRLAEALRHAAAVGVQEPQNALRAGTAMLGRRAQQ